MRQKLPKRIKDILDRIRVSRCVLPNGYSDHQGQRVSAYRIVIAARPADTDNQQIIRSKTANRMRIIGRLILSIQK